MYRIEFLFGRFDTGAIAIRYTITAAGQSSGKDIAARQTIPLIIGGIALLVLFINNERRPVQAEAFKRLLLIACREEECIDIFKPDLLSNKVSRYGVRRVIRDRRNATRIHSITFSCRRVQCFTLAIACEGSFRNRRWISQSFRQFAFCKQKDPSDSALVRCQGATDALRVRCMGAVHAAQKQFTEHAYIYI